MGLCMSFKPPDRGRRSCPEALSRRQNDVNKHGSNGSNMYWGGGPLRRAQDASEFGLELI